MNDLFRFVLVRSAMRQHRLSEGTGSLGGNGDKTGSFDPS
jgi:hypothetical protein